MRCSSSRGTLLTVGFGLAALALASGVRAQGLPCDAGTYEERLARRYNDECRKESPAILRGLESVTRSFYGAQALSGNWDERARGQLSLQRADVPDADGKPENLRKHLEDLKAQLDRAIDALENARRTDEALKIDFWEHIGEDSPASKYLKETRCGDKTAEAPGCAASYEWAADLGDRVFFARHTIATWRRPQAERLRHELARRGARWESYLYGSQFQYPWELVANRFLEERCPNRLLSSISRLLVGEACTPIERDQAGNLIRWREPPRYRAIVLHPDIGFLYNRDEPQGARAKAALVFQWFGYQWWRWENDAVSRLRGVSLVSTVSDNADARALGWGLQGRYNGYALAITSHGGRPVFTLSMDLLEKVSELDQELANKLKRP